MRRIFTSPRLENVERVAAMLKEEGIEARITHGRSYKGGARSHFTYRDNARTEPEPAVWIVKPDDQPKARALMRDAGLLDSGRSPTSYLSTTTLHGPRDAADPSKRRMFLVKLALLIGIVVVLSVALFAWRKPAQLATSGPAAAIPTAAPVQAPAPAKELINDSVGTAYRVDVPSALAAMLLGAELRAQDAADVCLSVDGAAPSTTVLASLQAEDSARIRSRSACAQQAGNQAVNAVSVDVGQYLTDGSGSGTVQVEIADYGKDGKRRVETRTLEVQRDGLQWEVKRIVL